MRPLLTDKQAAALILLATALQACSEQSLSIEADGYQVVIRKPSPTGDVLVETPLCRPLTGDRVLNLAGAV